ncbi:MAG: CoA-binding protein [Chloroflexi bacterium]|nr:CoA-binding protein [Chloroflexota bacterium]
MTTMATILRTSKTIAVVGLSDKPDRPAYQVAEYMQRAGYTIIPVHPTATTVLGEKVYRTLQEIPVSIDIVDVFRASKDVPEVVDDAIAAHVHVLWLQLDIRHEDAEAKATAAGITVITDHCLKIVHRDLHE